MAAAGTPLFLAAALEIRGSNQAHPFEFATTVKQVDTYAQRRTGVAAQQQEYQRLFHLAKLNQVPLT
jgi:hypothetical protein